MMAQSPKHFLSAHKALEIRMQEALSDLENFVTTFAYQSIPGTLSILSIEPPIDAPVETTSKKMARKLATVHRVTTRRSKDVVSFLMEREGREERQHQAIKLTA